MPSLPQRRSLRLSGYDYSLDGAYFVTLCVEKKSTLLGEVVGGVMQLNDAGRMIEQIWLELPKHYPGIRVDVCQIMPDHFHGIIWLETKNGKDEFSLTLGDIIQRFKSFTTHLYIEGVSKDGWRQFPGRLWQRSYFDHVIRNEQDLEHTRSYVVNNPQKWRHDREMENTASAGSNADSGLTMTQESGFTLIEMVVVIVIVGILAVLGGRFIARPVQGYVDLSRRAELVDRAEMALRRMQRDIRHALPNSIRVDGTGQYLEMINTVDGGRYRLYPDPNPLVVSDILDFSIADNGFDVLGDLSRPPVAGNNVVIYNVTTTGATGNAYANPPDNTAVVGVASTNAHINLSPVSPFGTGSPLQRFFLVDGPVTYACEGGILNRYSGYGLQPNQPTATLAGPDLVTRAVNGCSFSYAPGVGQRAGLVTLQLSLTEEGETITLLHQVHVVNVP